MGFFSSSDSSDRGVYEKVESLISPISSPNISSSPARRFSLARLFAALKALFLILLPTFISNRLRARSSPEEPQRPVRLLPTSYLDGLRGLFSCIVFVHHVIIPWCKSVDMGYGTVADRPIYDNYSFFKLPLIKVLHTGPTVPVFYVVSGFVMSYKPLRLIRKGDMDALAKAMTSSVFRRPMRLFLPPLAGTFLACLAAYAGFYTFNYKSMPGHRSVHPHQFPTLALQIGDWLRSVRQDITNPFTWRHPEGEYNSNLWTIPAQFRCSMITFLVLMGTAPVKPMARTGILIALWLYCFNMGRWDIAAYLAGVFISERKLITLEQEAASATDASPTLPQSTTKPTRGRSVYFWRFIFLVGLWFGSFPRVKAGDALNTPGFHYMAMFISRWEFWHTHSATLMVWAMGNDPLLQRFFTLAPFRYLGGLSFSIYLVHGPLLHWFGWSLVPKMIMITGNETMRQWAQGCALATAILLPIVVWVADLFKRLVEAPCGTLAGKI